MTYGRFAHPTRTFSMRSAVTAPPAGTSIGSTVSRHTKRSMRRQLKIWKLAACALALVPLAGCIIVPLPHTTPRSPEVRGTVLDARTGAPIEGARLSLNQPPHHATYTDVAGRFRLKATHNWHLMYVGEGHWPRRKDSSMGITQTNYLPVWGAWSGNVGDVFMKPKK